LGVGVGITRFSKSGPASVAGKILHPFFLNQARSVEGEAAGLKREELAIHIQAMAIVPEGERLSLAVFAGPSFFNVKQGWSRSFSTRGNIRTTLPHSLEPMPARHPSPQSDSMPAPTSVISSLATWVSGA
jgi:hypothetical protein